MRQAPAVGNVLGFALLFRDRKALLCLERRTLFAGVRMSDYEAEVPGLEFPIQAPASASEYRQRRCTATQVTLDAEIGAIQGWLESRLLGHTVGPLRVTQARLLANGVEGFGSERAPCIELEGTVVGGGHGWLRWECFVTAKGRRLVVEPGAWWWFASAPLDANSAWDELRHRLKGAPHDASGLAFDPAQETLTQAFVASGWKAPNLEGLEIAVMRMEPGSIALEFRSSSAAAAEPPAVVPRLSSPQTAAVEASAASVRSARSGGHFGLALSSLERLRAGVRSDPRAHAAALRWSVELLRHAPLDHASTLEQASILVARWRHIDPTSQLAARWELELFARSGAHGALLSAIEQSPHAATDAASARRDVAMAGLLLRKLGQPDRAKALLLPHRARLEGSDAPASFQCEVCLLLSLACSDDPEVCQGHLDAALAAADDVDHRTAIRIEVADALAKSGHPLAALEVVRGGIPEAPQDPALLEAAARLVSTGGAGDVAVELLRLRLDSTTGDEQLRLRRELALEAARAEDPAALELVRAALAADAQDAALLAAAATLESGAGHHASALSILGRLRERAPNGRAEARIRWQRVELLVALGRIGEVWAELWPALPELEPALQPAAFARAVEFTPAGRLEPWVRRLRLHAEPQAVIDALGARWRRWQEPDLGATALVEELLAAERVREALTVCKEVALRCVGAERAAWLARAASMATPQAAAALLDDALQAAPHDEQIADRLIELLKQTGQTGRLTTVWARRAADESLPGEQRLDALDRLIARRAGAREDKVAAARDDDELLALFTQRAGITPDDATTQLVLAEDETRAGNVDAAQEHFARALDLLDPDDPRGTDAARVLGVAALERGDLSDARMLLERTVAGTPQDAVAWSLLRRISVEQEDDDLLARALGIQRGLAKNPAELASVQLELARLHRRAGRTEAALTEIAAASSTAEVGSPQHLAIAEAWLELAQDENIGPKHEAEARAELRRALGADVPSAELRREALLWADRLGNPAKGVELIAEAFGQRPEDALLLATLKRLGTDHALPEHYIAALALGIDKLPAGPRRDELLSELATSAVENGDAMLALRSLDRLSQDAAATEQNLDLRDWAVHQLGREDDELRAIGDRLGEHPSDSLALARLRRLARDDAAAVAEHLLGMATRAQPQTAAALSLLALRHAKGSNDGPVLRRCLRRALATAGTDSRVWDAWRALIDQEAPLEDESTIRDLLAMAREAAGDDPDRLQALSARLETSMASLPASRLLHRLAWDWARDERPEQPAGLAHARIVRVIEGHALSERARAELFIGLASHLGRREAASLLQRRAEEEMGSAAAVWALAAALGDRGDVPEQLAVLEMAVQSADDDLQRVDALKRIAHVSGETLQDPARAIGHLEAALELAPTDPDLLLPLLEHYFVETDLSRATELTRRVLVHVPMGEAAYLSLAHRAADAALAQGDHAEATELLRLATERAPEEARTRARLAELEALKDDPTHRLKLLAAIANRQTGEARIEALEERARILVDPLERLDDAIAQLETISFEAPRRATSIELLKRLYRDRERWSDLVELLEHAFPGQHGVLRCQTLQEIARIYREELLDLPRAEQALRIALEHLGDDEQDTDLAEQLRVELVGDLEGQGRYVDLSIYLERALAPEIEGSAEAPLHQTRAELLTELARIYRGPLDDETKAGRIYERLEAYNCLPDEGLATLARTYHRTGRHADLVRILNVRRRALDDNGEVARRAAVDQRIAELLEGPLGRPHEAATHYLDAYLADPRTNVAAGARARVLLSGTDAVANVRLRLLDRLPRIPQENRPALLTLLGDILGPQDEYEQEAETRYHEALELDAEHAPAREALGRLLARQGRLEEAVGPLVAAACHRDIPPRRAADSAAIAARALLELERPAEAEQVLKDALQRAPDSQRALLELARLYERLGRTTEQAIVLENLSQLPLSSMLGAEVAFRRATLLMPATRDDPYCPEAERARAYLLEAVSADAKHVAARQTLLELATSRLEWSIVAHMHYLAIRELPPGPQRALHHLDLAQTYLLHLDDSESAIRNVESAITQAPDDLVVNSRVGQLAARLPGPARVAERFERIAGGSGDLDDSARARLWLLAADLRMTDDDPAAAEAASQRVLRLPEVSTDFTAAAQRNLELLAGDEARDLRQQKSGLLKLLELEEQAVERLHLLSRLRELGQSLGDTALVEQTSREQLDLAGELEGSEGEGDLEAASAALRDVYAERGEFAEVVDLYERLAARSTDPASAAAALIEAARFSWSGLRRPGQAVVLLRRALALAPDHEEALAMLGEVTRQSEDPGLEASVYEELQRVPAPQRSARLNLQLAALASNIGKEQEAIALLRPLCVQPRDSDVRYEALRQLDTLLARVASPTERLPILRRLLEESIARESEERPTVALELAHCEFTLGDLDGARRTLEIGLEHEATHRGLLELKIRLLRAAEDWDELASAIEHLAASSVDPSTHAGHLVDAAEVHLRRQALATTPRDRARAAQEARRMLLRACDLAPSSVAPRVALLPLAFASKRWDEVLELSLEIREHAGDDEEVLILAGITEALRHGQRSLARDLGFRHGSGAQDRYLFPGLRQLLTEVAAVGPLPRLDAVLAAAASLCDGRAGLATGLRAWAAGRPIQVGLALGLARLAEADGEAELARSLYQITAFMAPDGPVPPLVARLPIAVPPADLDPVAAGPMEGRSVLRSVLVTTRDAFSGITHDPESAHSLQPPPNETSRTRIALADSIVAGWRRRLDLPLPVVWSRAKLVGGVGVRNWTTPTIVVGSGVAIASLTELRYRLARATATIACGLAVLEDGQGAKLGDLLDALGCIANPSHVPTGEAARALADVLPHAAGVAPLLRTGDRPALAEELAYWLTERGGVERLGRQFSRAQLLFATRLCGQLDGALLALSHDNGFVRQGRPDAVATLRFEDAQWLMRALGMY